MRFTSANQEAASKAFKPFTTDGKLDLDNYGSWKKEIKGEVDKAYADRYYERKRYKAEKTPFNKLAKEQTEKNYKRLANVEKTYKQNYKMEKANVKAFDKKYAGAFSREVELMEHSPMKVAATNRDASNLSRIAKGKKGPFPGMKYVAADSRNMYSGLRTTGGANALILAGTLVAAGIGAARGGIEGNKQFRSAPEDMGYSSRMSSDAVGSVSKGNRDLGATGDLVFGLNNTRKGGQL